MINLSQPVMMRNLDDVVHLDFLRFITSYCLSGEPMHREALISTVLKLIQISRDMELEQNDRDAAASIATHLANAGLKAYGSESEFGTSLKSRIHNISNKYKY